LAIKEQAVASRQRTVSRFLFHHEILIKNNMTIVPHQPYLSLFPRLNLKLKDHHFDTTEVTEAESQTVLNTLTEHDFQDAFKQMAEALGTAHTRRMGLL
jgi:hypothetical protein